MDQTLPCQISFREDFRKEGKSLPFSKNKDSPFDSLYFKLFENKILKGYYASDRLNLSPRQRLIFQDFFQGLRKKPQESEKCLGHFFKYGPYSPAPLLPIVKKHEKSKFIKTYYG